LATLPLKIVASAQGRGYRLRHQRRVGQRRQLNQPHPIGVFVPQRRRQFQRQARFASATRAGEGEQPRALQPTPHLGDCRGRRGSGRG
jgi:hypothetical protein